MNIQSKNLVKRIACRLMLVIAGTSVCFASGETKNQLKDILFSVEVKNVLIDANNVVMDVIFKNNSAKPVVIDIEALKKPDHMASMQFKNPINDTTSRHLSGVGTVSSGNFGSKQIASIPNRAFTVASKKEYTVRVALVDLLKCYMPEVLDKNIQISFSFQNVILGYKDELDDDSLYNTELRSEEVLLKVGKGLGD